ncbi:hypothetical protein ACFFGV_19520 [Pontibacillus salicampi]|uniref:Uncharacterized protein n=1 Tax=Pontibacillus salicampi TaxID=1449801 RepID=A0ABV6LTN5_9BACI
MQEIQFDYNKVTQQLTSKIAQLEYNLALAIAEKQAVVEYADKLEKEKEELKEQLENNR